MAQAQRRALLGRAIAFIPQAPLTALNPVLTIGAQFDEHLARFDGAGSNDRRRRRARHARRRAVAAGERIAFARFRINFPAACVSACLIAMAFASNPRLVVADEPTTALDLTMHAPIIRLTRRHQRQHGTAVIFDHPRPAAGGTKFRDDVIVMYAGRAIESGPARAVLSNQRTLRARCLLLANPSMRADRRALHVMAGADADVCASLPAWAGCHFAPRCPLAAEECRRSEPPNFLRFPPAAASLPPRNGNAEHRGDGAPGGCEPDVHASRAGGERAGKALCVSGRLLGARTALLPSRTCLSSIA